MIRTARLLVPAALAAALLSPAPAAEARSPAAAEQGSLEWILQKLKKDREQDQAARHTADPVKAYQEGEAPLDEWKALADRIQDKRTTKQARDQATTAILVRFKAEDNAGKTDGKILEATKKAICRELLGLMNSNDEDSRFQIKRLLDALVPQSGVRWSTGDTPSRRAKAYNDLKKWLKG